MLSILLFYAIYYVLHFSLYGVFKKAGKNPIHVFIPYLQDATWLELIGKNKYKALWGLVPYVNYLFALTWVTDTLSCFNKKSFLQHTFASFFGYLSFIFIGFFDKTAQYIGPIYENNKRPQRNIVREWSDALVFALVAAAFVRMFTLEAYKIPTTSMEGSLLAGDFLFVSKFNYGARIPNTPLAFPLVHHTMPFGLGKAYSKIIQLNYKRLPGIESIKKGDVVVFNYPGDAIEFPERPIDKRENYVKRCVAIAGDKLEIKNAQLYINGTAQPKYKNLQLLYDVELTQPLNRTIIKDLGLLWFYDFIFNSYADGFGNPTDAIQNLEQEFDQDINNNTHMGIFLTREQIKLMQERKLIKTIKPFDNNQTIVYKEDIFVAPTQFKWTVDNFGPITIPKKGMKIELTIENIINYFSTIKYFEHNQQVDVVGSSLYINGEPVTHYTFKQDYYFMMGDNRHNSLDSRYWGFVPEDHVVGKPLFVFLSKNNFESFPDNIKRDRIFKTVTTLCK